MPDQNAKKPAGAGADKALDLAARTLVHERLRCVRRVTKRKLDLDDIVLRPTAPPARRHLFEEARELYWNELNWEQLTDEELHEDGELTEMVFPGLLTLMDALLPTGQSGEPDREREHRDVAHDFVIWLARRILELRSSKPEDDTDRQRLRREERITDDLLDLVAYRLYSLTDAEMEGLQA
ncbi:MAG: hypothetical protein ABFS14_12930 [Gemmatimonadota bacterium]